MKRSFEPRCLDRRVWLAAALMIIGGCSTTRVPTIEDHYRGNTGAAAPAGPPAAPVPYAPSEASFDPVVPLRTGPETIAVLELGHAADDGAWVAPHYVVVMLRPERWAERLPSAWERPVPGTTSWTPAFSGRAPAAAVPPRFDGSDQRTVRAPRMAVPTPGATDAAPAASPASPTPSSAPTEAPPAGSP